MAYTRTSLLADLRVRLNESVAAVWTDARLKAHINNALEGLYPTFYKRNVATTTAGAGPLQTQPTTARNIYQVSLLRAGTNRLRPLRNWVEGAEAASALIPKSGITGETLVWAWTSGWAAPALDADTIDLIPEAKELLLIRAHIAALEDLLTLRVSPTDRYFALEVRERVTDDEMVSTLEALHASARERADRAQPLPEVMR